MHVTLLEFSDEKTFFIEHLKPPALKTLPPYIKSLQIEPVLRSIKLPASITDSSKCADIVGFTNSPQHIGYGINSPSVTVQIKRILTHYDDPIVHPGSNDINNRNFSFFQDDI